MPKKDIDCFNNEVIDVVEIIPSLFKGHSKNLISKDYLSFVIKRRGKIGGPMNSESVDKIRRNLKVLYLQYYIKCKTLDSYTSDYFIPTFIKLNSSSGNFYAGGLKIVENSFIGGFPTEKLSIPFWLENGITFRYSEDLLYILTFMLNNSSLNNIISSIESFSDARKNDESITWRNRIISLYWAFLQIIKTSESRDERKGLRDLVGEVGTKLITYPYPIIYTKNNTTTEILQLNVLQIWGEEFYKLRCHLIHGDDLTKKHLFINDLSNPRIIKKNSSIYDWGIEIYLNILFYKLRCSLIPLSSKKLIKALKNIDTIYPCSLDQYSFNK